MSSRLYTPFAFTLYPSLIISISLGTLVISTESAMLQEEALRLINFFIAMLCRIQLPYNNNHIRHFKLATQVLKRNFTIKEVRKWSFFIRKKQLKENSLQMK